MIVVFVIDTSPSMAKPANQNSKGGVSRLDVAKMATENISRSMDKRVADHNRSVLVASAQSGGRQHQVRRLEQFDEFMLLSTSLQPDNPPKMMKDSRKRSNSLDRALGTSNKRARSTSFDSIGGDIHTTSTCGAGGRLLFGCVDSLDNGVQQTTGMLPHPPNRADFERELKRLRVAAPPRNGNSSSNSSFPEESGGATGLNMALSHGLGLLSRYRLTRGRFVENFGMGRLPWFDHQMASITKDKNDFNTIKNTTSPLQPACLILLTDGECLTEKGGGGLRLNFGNIPLRELYKEPFRWDQRIFILHIASNSAKPLHPSLQALCEVTGGAVIKAQQNISYHSKLLSRMSPPQPNACSIPHPLRLPSMIEPPVQSQNNVQTKTEYFLNGGPVAGFQAFERDDAHNMPSLHRAMLLFSPAVTPEYTAEVHPMSPVWLIPENYYPNKKLDVLPPRPSQPLIHYSRHYQAVGSHFFDPLFVMKALHHLDELHVSIHQLLIGFGEKPPPITNRMLQRDVYICDWLAGENTTRQQGSTNSGAPRTTQDKEYFPAGVLGAGRPTISGELGENILNIGILHVPPDCVQLKDLESNSNTKSKMATLTLLPPDAHILIPLLIKVAETELHQLNRIKEKGTKAGALPKTVHMEDLWKSDFRAYIFRLPPYYLPAMRRALRTLLPTSILQLINTDVQEPLPLLCMSRTCAQKIKLGEQAAKDGNDWLRGVERSLTQQRLPIASAAIMNNTESFNQSAQRGSHAPFTHGAYDPCMTVSSYKASLRGMPPPWKNKKLEENVLDKHSYTTDILGALPKSCLLPYYETRRRWIFGGSGLTCRGLHVEGTNNDGVNSHRYPVSQSPDEKPLIALVNIGADTINQTSISVMGDFRERLNWSQVPLTGYGGSNAIGSAVTTAPDGSPALSVEDEVFPLTFFNPESGDFVDTPQARSRARMAINFGNPFDEKRGGSLVPEKYESQRPSTPSTSPSRDDVFESIEAEGEGEAAFKGKVSRSSRHNTNLNDSEDSSMDEVQQPPSPPAQLEAAVTETPKHSNLPVQSIRKPAPPALAQSNHPKPAPPKRKNSGDAVHTHTNSNNNHSAAAIIDLQNPDQKPHTKLPPGWMCVWSKSQKRWYFFNTTNNKSVWEWPPPGSK